MAPGSAAAGFVTDGGVLTAPRLADPPAPDRHQRRTARAAKKMGTAE